MKLNTIVILLMCLTNTIAYAQPNDCKYDKNEIDKFTSKKIIWTKWERLSPLISTEYAPSVRCVVEDSTKKLLVFIGSNEYTYARPSREQIDNYLVVPTGSKAMLLMENGKPLELMTQKEHHSSGDYIPPRSRDNSSDQYKLTWEIVLAYLLDDNAIKSLSSQGVTNLRIYYKPDVYRDFVVGKKKYAIIQNLMACIK